MSSLQGYTKAIPAIINLVYDSPLYNTLVASPQLTLYYSYDHVHQAR